MSPVSMESGSEYNSSLSSEECQSPALDVRGKKRPRTNQMSRKREKNRNAAQKSRKKQTERADVLHEELQCLEHSNTTLEDEIAALKREHHHYTTLLEQHQPHCGLRNSSSPSSAFSSSSNTATAQSSPPPSVCLPASASPAEAPLPSVATLSSLPGDPLRTLLSHVGLGTSLPGTSSGPTANAPLPPAHTGLAPSLLTTAASVSSTAQTAQTGVFPLTLAALSDVLFDPTSASISPCSSLPTMPTRPPSCPVNLLTEQGSIARSGPSNHLSLSDPNLLISTRPENTSVAPWSRAENTSPGHVSSVPCHSSPAKGVSPSYGHGSTLPSFLAPSIDSQTHFGSCSAPIFNQSPKLNSPTISLLSLLTVPSPIIVPETTSSNLIASLYAPDSISASRLLPSAALSPRIPSLSPFKPFPSAVADSSMELSTEFDLQKLLEDLVQDPTSGWCM